MFNDSAELKVGSVGFDMKWLVMIWVGKYSVSLNKQFHLLKGFIMNWEPWKFLCRFGNFEKLGK